MNASVKTANRKGTILAGLATLACVASCAVPAVLLGGLGTGLGVAFGSWLTVPIVAVVGLAAGFLAWKRLHRIC